MFIVKDEKILLIEKKRGLGAGKINGPGGKIDPGETPLQAIIRETQEELLITPINPRKLGELWFSMSICPDILWLLGICFLREAPERAIGPGRRAGKWGLPAGGP